MVAACSQPPETIANNKVASWSVPIIVIGQARGWSVEALKDMDAMTWTMLAAAVAISIAVLFNKAIKWFLKLVVIAVVLFAAAYFLMDAGVLELPRLGG